MRINFSKEQINERILFENSWWQTNEIDTYYSSMQKREYFKLFYPEVKKKTIRRAVVLMGPRRVGKTVLMYHSIQELINDGINPNSIAYFTIETPIYNGISLDELLRYYLDLKKLKHTDDLYVFFDEIQYLKEWEIHLKNLVDSYHNIKFVVSGSAAAALKLKSNESGAGRFTDFLLPPLTFHEYLSLKNINELVKEEILSETIGKKIIHSCDDIAELNRHFIDYINFGGYPEVSLSNEIQSNPGRYIRNDIIDKVLLRDLPTLYGIDDITELNSLFTYIAYNSGNEMSLDGISNSSGVSKNTIKKYITYFEAAFLIRIIHRVDNNAKKFKRANFFKIYLTNPSLRCALFSPIKEDDKFIGNLVETAIFSQWGHSDTELFYARWGTGEVDIVCLEENLKPLWAVEIKWSNKHAADHSIMKNVDYFCKLHNMPDAIVTSYDERIEKRVDGIMYEFVPSSLYCYMVGKNLMR